MRIKSFIEYLLAAPTWSHRDVCRCSCHEQAVSFPNKHLMDHAPRSTDTDMGLLIRANVKDVQWKDCARIDRLTDTESLEVRAVNESAMSLMRDDTLQTSPLLVFQDVPVA